MASGFYLIVFKKLSASFTGIIGRVVGFGGVGRVDSAADDYFTSSKYTRHLSCNIGAALIRLASEVGLLALTLSNICVLSFASHQARYCTRFVVPKTWQI